MANYGVYISYIELKQRLLDESEALFEVSDDNTLKNVCAEISFLLNQECKRHFFPLQDTKYYDFIDPWEIRLPDDLLEVSTLYTDNGDTLISSSSYFLMTGPSYNTYPKTKITLKQSGSISLFDFNETPQQANIVTGVWGFNDQYGEAWEAKGTVSSTLLVGGVTLTPSDVDLFNEQNLIRFGSGPTVEYAFISEKDSISETLTIERGVNGSTPIQQEIGQNIYIYKPMPDLVNTAMEFAVFMYRRMAAAGGENDVSVVSGSGTIIAPSSWPTNVKKFIKRNRKPRTSQSWR